MKQSYKKVWYDYGYSWRRVELTGLCKKITGGPEDKERTYYQAQRRLFGVPIVKHWIFKDNVSFFDPIVETEYECEEKNNEL